MIDEEWEKRRMRAALVAFQTGRPVFADTRGELRFADGDHEQVPSDVGVAEQPLPQATAQITWWARIKRWLRGTS